MIVSLWGSNLDGCFLQVVVQKSPDDGQAELQQLVPKTLEIGVNNQIIELERNPSTKVRGFKVDYTYTEGGGTSVGNLISTKDSEEIWKDLNQPNKIAQQKGNYHLAAASKTADNIPTQDLARLSISFTFCSFYISKFMDLLQ